MMNKKGGTFAIWVEIVIFLAIFLGVLAIIGTNMNSDYGKNYDLTMGLELNDAYANLSQFGQESINDTTQGQAQMSDFGIIKLLTIPSMLVSLAGTLWSFVSGQFIYRIVASMQLGDGYTLLIGGAFQLLYIITLVFVFIKLVLKIDI